MNTADTLAYIAVMAGVTYLVRALPLLLIRHEIRNRWIRSFLYYVPYVTLSVMTFPAILDGAGASWIGAAALALGIALSWFGSGLFTVACAVCILVYVLRALAGAF